MRQALPFSSQRNRQPGASICSSKGSPEACIPLAKGRDLPDAVRPQLAVRVQKQQDIARGDGGSRVLLPATPRRGVDHGSPGVLCPCWCMVAASAVDDNHLICSGRVRRFHRSRYPGGLVNCRNDHRNPQLPLPSPHFSWIGPARLARLFRLPTRAATFWKLLKSATGIPSFSSPRLGIMKHL